MNNKILLVCIAATLILGGCDWVRSRLDLPTSKDIAAKKALIIKREMQLDSQRNAKLDSSTVQVRDSASNAKAIAEAEADDARLEAQQKEVQAKMAQQQIAQQKEQQRIAQQKEQQRIAQQKEQQRIAQQKEQQQIAQQKEQQRIAQQKEQQQIAQQKEQQRIAQQKEQQRIAQQKEQQRIAQQKEEKGIAQKKEPRRMAQQKDQQPIAQQQKARQVAAQPAAHRQQPVAQPAAPQQHTVNVDVAQTQLKYRYYLIVGSYRQAASVEKRLRQLRNMEASPVAIPLKNGLTMVSAVGFNSLSDAKAAVSDVADLAPDAWVYSRASGLHK